jgi:hypothetical protein
VIVETDGTGSRCGVVVHLKVAADLNGLIIACIHSAACYGRIVICHFAAIQDIGVVALSTTGDSPVFSSGSFKTSDGGELDVKIKSMTFSAKKPLTFYVLDLSTFDSSWMITDLR